MTTGAWKPEIIFFPFLLVWLNDTFAYLCGSRFGRHKLFPRISPKKSWEGAVGGGVVTILVALLIAPYIEGLTIVNDIIISCIVNWLICKSKSAHSKNFMIIFRHNYTSHKAR